MNIQKILSRVIFKGIFVIILLAIYLAITFYFFKKKKILVNNDVEYDLIIPSRLLDIQLFIKHKQFYQKFLGHKNIILICPPNKNKLNLNEPSISFINEDSLVPKERVIEFLWKMRSIKSNRIGWYEQQFLKMAYSRICQKEYYLVWDLDTIPIKPIKMFQGTIPFFDMKTEHHIPYFITIERLIPGLNFTNQSYISEHMMIKTELMKNLIYNIEMNNKIPGKLFWEKILMCIDIKNIHKSGFSEYEIYGSFVDNKFPNLYNHRRWYSRRDISFFFNSSENLNEKDIKWLSQDYHALSFERWKVFRFIKKNLKIIKNSKIQKLYKPNNFFKIYENISKRYRKICKYNKI